MSSSVEIPFWLQDRPKWVSGITRHTTCSDVIASLVKAQGHGHGQAGKDEHAVEAVEAVEAVAGQLVLVEQWRGVERPLAASARVWRLWAAWGDERPHVKFVVKRISGSGAKDAAPQPQPPAKQAAARCRTRRRNSRLLQSSSTPTLSPSSSGATLHPSALLSSSERVCTSELERLLRVIVAQGETIHSQLKRLQQRQGQIDTFEQQVHAERSKRAGKDYLLNAYLQGQSGDQSTLPPDHDETALAQMLESLSRLELVYDRLAEAEEGIDRLQGQMAASLDHRTDQRSDQRTDALHAEVTRWHEDNDALGRQIEGNKQGLASLQAAFDERSRLVSRLEMDVGLAESECTRLQLHLQRIRAEAVCEPAMAFADDLDDEDLDDELADDAFRLSSSKLYEKTSPGRGEVQQLSLLQRLRVKAGLALATTLLTDSSQRTAATGSPGSAGSAGSASSGRETATPDLPPIPCGDFPPANCKMRTSGEVSDSNSDTGLSSLHSSSDEGTYVLDTLV